MTIYYSNLRFDSKEYKLILYFKVVIIFLLVSLQSVNATIDDHDDCSNPFVLGTGDGITESLNGDNDIHDAFQVNVL